MPRIFINYRRDDTAGQAGRLYDDLVDHFGADQVFIDIDTIAPGADFVEIIEGAVDQSDVVIVLIGKRWLTGSDARSRRRLHNPDDFVRLEIATALERGKRIIPVLVQGAEMPRSQVLPDVLMRLARRNAIEVRDTRWKDDVARLIQALKRLPGAMGPVSAAQVPGDSAPGAEASSIETSVRPDWPQLASRDTGPVSTEAASRDNVAELYEIGAEAFAAQAWAEAIDRLEAVVALDAAYRDAARKLDEARRQQALTESYAEALRLHQAGQWQQVIDAFMRIRAQDPAFPDPDGLLASAEKALAAMEREEHLAALYSQGSQYLHAGEWPRALERFEAIQKFAPDYRDTKALTAQARQAIAQHDASDAEQTRPGFERPAAPGARVLAPAQPVQSRAPDPTGANADVRPIAVHSAVIGRSTFFTAVGWAVAWAVGSAIFANLTYTFVGPGTDALPASLIAGTTSGAIGALAAGLALQRAGWSLRSRDVGMLVIGWAISNASIWAITIKTSPAVSRYVVFNNFMPLLMVGGLSEVTFMAVLMIAGLVSGTIGGLIAGLVLRRGDQSIQPQQILVLAVAWATGGVMGWLACVIPYNAGLPAAIYKAFGGGAAAASLGAVAGAVQGAIGGGIMFRRLARRLE